MSFLLGVFVGLCIGWFWITDAPDWAISLKDKAVTKVKSIFNK